MTTGLPRLRDDLLVKGVDDKGTLEMSVPGGSSIRVSTRVYRAVDAMRQMSDFDAWLSAVAQFDSSIGRQQLEGLLRKLVSLGFVVTPQAHGGAQRLDAVNRAPPAAPSATMSAVHTFSAPMPTPATAPPAMTSAMPAVASTGGPPRARSDLHIDAKRSKGLVHVTDPRTGRTFQIYDFEYRLLQKVDGSKNVDELVAEFAGLGHVITRDQVITFLREMNGYGFLADSGSVDVSARRPLGAPLKTAQPEREVPQSEWDEEERRLFQGGLGLFRQGQLDAAEGYFLALVETNPKNSEAMSMLQIVRDAKAGRVTGPVLLENDEDVEQSLSGLEEGAEAAGDDEESAPEERDADDASGIWDEAEQQVKADPAVAARRRRRRLWLVARIAMVPAALIAIGLVVPYSLTITYPCHLEPLHHGVVRAPRAGVLDEILVEEGQQVSAGDVLGHLQNANFRTAVVKSEAALERAKSELKLLMAGSRPEEVDRARARVNGLAREVKVAKGSVARLAKLVRQGVAPRGQLEDARQRLVGLQGDLSQASAGLRLAKAGSRPDELRKKEAEIRGLEAQLELDREILESTVLRATMGGVVTTRRPKELVHTRVTAGDNIFEIATLDVMRAEIFVDERDFDVLQEGLPVTLRVASHPTESFGGKVKTIAPKIERIEENNVARVGAEVENRGGMLVPNMTGYAEIEAGDQPIAYLVVRRLLRWVRVRFLI